MDQKLRRFSSLLTAIFVGVAAAPAAFAAEGGVGFYLLGSKGPLAGITPPEGVYIQDDFYLYSGSAGASREIPIGGKVVANIDADAYINLATVLWSTDLSVLGGTLAFQGTLPIGGQDVSASASLVGGPSRSVSDSVFTVGDPVLGAQIGWNHDNFHWNFTTLVNVPIGDYQEGQIANIAFHRWGTDLSGALTWLDPTIGIDLSGVVGVTFNGENPDTDYTTGTEFHAEWAAVKNFSPAFSAGLVGYYYKQITGDSGPGASLGDFEGQVAALGGTVAWNFKAGNTPVTLRAKVYREFAVENRLEGTSGFVTLSFPLGVSSH